jgi:hypothetical protein
MNQSVSSRSLLSSSHFEIIDSVNETWEEIKQIPDYEGVAGTLLFQK